jgi:hypothetical protein
MTDEAFASFAEKYPDVKRCDLEELLTREMLAERALCAQRSEIGALRRMALDAMGTEREMRFSDVEMGMLQASLADGRQALKEIMEKTPVETPACGDGATMRNSGRQKKT